MQPAGSFEIVRDPIWNNIGIDADALAVLDSAPFQRLRYIRQLGHAFLVYPGATHTRFEHALGAYHLARRALTLLNERGDLAGIPEDDVTLVRLAALLHDIGHYPFSHALEEAGLTSHETLAREHLAHPELADTLRQIGIPDVTDRLAALIAGHSPSPLRGLISGTLDLDKIEYLTRDARMCGVPYGTVDVDRLLHSLTVVARSLTDSLTGADGSRTVGIHEKGVSALESLLFAKYQMYRNVYWHHAVRSATAMFKRVVRSAIATGRLTATAVAHATDETLMETLRAEPLAAALRRRRLYKRVLDLPAGELPPGSGEWVAAAPDLVEQVEDRLARELGLSPGGVLLDFPAKPEMLGGEVPVLGRAGAVAPARLRLQHIADDLHTAARRLRLYTAEPVQVERRAVVSLVERAPSEVADALGRDRALLAV